MKRISVALCGLVLAALPCTSALASPITNDFSFSFTGPLFSGQGAFQTTSLGNGEYLIDAVTGTVDGKSIDGILPTGSYPKGFLQTPNDNLLFFPGSFGFNAPTYFDNAGVSFEVGTGTSAFDVNLNDTFFFENAVAGSLNLTEGDSISVKAIALPGNSPVPEPSSLVLMGTGLLAAAGAVRRKLSA